MKNQQTENRDSKKRSHCYQKNGSTITIGPGTMIQTTMEHCARNEWKNMSN